MKRFILPIVTLLICHFSFAQICNKEQLPLNLQNGLVGYYPFCGNANDGSGSGNNGVVSGATLTTDRFGNANSAYNFNGTNNYITIANVAANTFTSTFSISVWVKPAIGYGSGSSPNGTQNQIVSKWGYGGVNNAAYSLGVDQAGIAFTGVHNGSASSSVNSSPSTISINEWHHLVSTLTGGVLKLYVDNVLVKTISNSVNAQNSRYTLDIAREALGNYGYFKGVIDDIQLYNRALNACEVNQIYTSTNTTFTTPSILTFNPLPSQTSLCGSSIGLDAGSGFTSYLWNTGATSQTISATTSGEYKVTVTNASGCTASDTVNVSLVKADILQSDQNVCSNTPLALSVNSYANQSAKSIDFDNVGLAALDVTGGTAGSVSGVSGNGLSISRPTEVKTKDQTYGYGDYEVDARTGNNTSNQYLSVLLPLNSWTNEAISIDSRPSGTDDVGWGVYVNAVRVAFANGSHPASASNWYKMKIRVTPDSVKCWINSTLLYQGLNTTVPRNIGAVKLSTFSTSHFDNLKYTPYQTFSSVLWSTSATTSTISVTPTATTTYYATISDGISSCTDSVTLTVANIVGFAPLQDTVKVCGDSIVLDAGTGFASYNWSNGATTRAITAKASGSYIATVTNASGCSASDTSYVSIVKAKILQRDTTICLGNSITLAIDSSSLNKSSACLKSNLPAQLQNGLIAYYPFCGNANDGSGNGINGILFGAPTLVADRFGNSNAAYNFNGTNQYIQTGSISEAITTKTISAWVKLSNMSQMGGGLAAVQSSNGSIFDAVVYNETNSGWGFGSDNLTRTKWSGVKETASEWVMLTATYENNSYKLYRNGVLISSTTQFPITSFGTTSKFNIGLRHNNGGTPYLNGVIDDVYFYNKVLSSSEVLSLYNATAVSWSTGASTNSITVTPTTTTKYFVTVSDGITTCKDSITVTVSDIGSFNPLQDTVKVCGDSTVLDAGAGYASYIWSNGATTRTITARASGKYSVTVSTAAGCNASDTSVVSIVKAKILQRDTTICKGSRMTLAIDSLFSRVIYQLHQNSFQGPSSQWSNLRLLNYNSQSVAGNYMNDSLQFVLSNLPIHDSILVTADLYLFDSWDGNCGGAQGPDYWGMHANGGGLFRTTFSNFPFGSQTCSNVQAYPGSVGTSNAWGTGAEQRNLPAIMWNAPISTKYPFSRSLNHNSSSLKLSFFGNNLQTDESWGIDNVTISTITNKLQVTWSTGATTNSISVNPITTTKYFVTVSDGITSCMDSVTVTVSDIGSFNPLQDTVKVCGDSVLLDAGAGFASYNWSNGATTRIINADASGKYFVTVTNASGCSAIDTSVVSIINANIIQSDTTVCKGGNLTLQINLKPNQNATWSTGATTPSIVVNPTVKTTYKVTVSDSITTCTDSVVVDVSSSELKVTDPAAVCSPGVVNLTDAAVTAGSAAGLTYTYWKDANASQSLANPDKVSVSGTYYIVGTSATGCTSAPTAVKVTVNPLPVATVVTPTQTTICDKSTLTLTATGGTSYQWLLNGAVIAGATSSTHAASQAGSYEVNVIALGCTSKVAAPVNLSLITAAVPKFSNSSTCIDVPVSYFNETDTTTSGSVSWLWDFGDGQTSTIFNPVYTYKKSGAFNVKLTVTPKLCSSLSDSISKNITVDVPPVGIKYPNVLAVKNKAMPLSARFIANGYSYLWMPSTGLNNGAIQKPVFNASQEQLYRVRLTSPGGCITMDTVKVSVYDSSDIFVPKAFSPNKDGKNDILQPFLVNITTLKYFRVYNRWGQLMFQTSDSRQGWDGMYNYKPQPLETYTWIAEGIDGNGTTIFKKGQTILIR
jgi:gliding motility-associated-like protein